jgi:hypothetical protein
MMPFDVFQRASWSLFKDDWCTRPVTADGFPAPIGLGAVWRGLRGPRQDSSQIWEFDFPYNPHGVINYDSVGPGPLLTFNCCTVHIPDGFDWLIAPFCREIAPSGSVEHAEGTDHPLHFALGFGCGRYSPSQSFLVSEESNVGRLTWTIGPYVTFPDRKSRLAIVFYTEDLALENPHSAIWFADDFDGHVGPRLFITWTDVRLSWQSPCLKIGGIR